MKVLIISDTHGKSSCLKQIHDIVGDVDMLIHCNLIFYFFQTVFNLTDPCLFCLLRLPVKFIDRIILFSCLNIRYFLWFYIQLRHDIVFFQIIIIVSNIIYNRLTCQLKDPRRRLIDKIAVMGNEKYGSGILV